MKITSKNLSAITRRIKNLPTVTKRVTAGAKYHVESIRKEVVQGLKTNSLVKPPLKPRTIQMKRRLGRPYTITPLVGKGDTDTRSMINGLTVEKTRSSSYRLVAKGKHYSGTPMSLLWTVHENGATITNGFGKGILIKIPARHPLRYGFRKYMQKKLYLEDNEKIRKEIRKRLRAIK